MINSRPRFTNEIVTVDPLEVKHWKEIFEDDGVAYDVWLPRAIDNPKQYKNASSPEGLTLVLNDLVEVSGAGAPDWQRWQKPDGPKDIPNFYSRPFLIPLTYDTTEYRFSIKQPFDHFEIAFVELEVRTGERSDPDIPVTYVGPQARFQPGKKDPVRMAYIGPKNPSSEAYQTVTHNGDLSTIWDRFVKAAVKAHVEFVKS